MKTYQKALQLISCVLTLALPQAGCGDSGFASMTDGPEISKNTVAVEISNLPQRFQDVYSNGVAFSPDAQYLAVMSETVNNEHENIYIWDWRRQHTIRTIEHIAGAISGRSTNPLQFNSDGTLLAACGVGGGGTAAIRIWKTKDWSIARDVTDTGNGGCTAMGFSPDGKFIARAVSGVGKPGDKLIVHSTVTWEPIWGKRWDDFDAHALAFNPSGTLLAVAGVTIIDTDPHSIRFDSIKREGTIFILDFKRHTTVRVIKCDVLGPIAWSPDGTRIAAVSNYGLDVFDAISGERAVHEIVENPGHRNIRYTPNGRYLIESDYNGRGTGLGFSIWDGQGRHLLQKMSIGDVAGISVSEDSKYLAAGATGHTTIYELK